MEKSQPYHRQKICDRPKAPLGIIARYAKDGDDEQSIVEKSTNMTLHHKMNYWQTKSDTGHHCQLAEDGDDE